MIGIVGALVILGWSWSLLRDSGAVLLDYIPEHEDLPEEVRAAIETEHDEIVDLHVWRLGPGHHGAIVSGSAAAPHRWDAALHQVLGEPAPEAEPAGVS